MFELALLLAYNSSFQAQSEPARSTSIIRSNTALYSFESHGSVLYKTPLSSLTKDGLHNGSVSWKSVSHKIYSGIFDGSQMRLLVEDASRQLDLANLPHDGASPPAYLKLSGLPSPMAVSSVKQAQLLIASGRLLLRIQAQPTASPESVRLAYWELDRNSGRLKPLKDKALVGDTPIVVSGINSIASTVSRKADGPELIHIGPLAVSRQTLRHFAVQVIPYDLLEQYRPFGLIGAEGTSYLLASYENRENLRIIEANPQGKVRATGRLTDIELNREASYQWTPCILSLGRNRFCIASGGVFRIVRLKLRDV